MPSFNLIRVAVGRPRLHSFLGGGVAVIAAFLIFAGTGDVARAQLYPPPDGYCFTSLSDPLPGTGESVLLTVTAADRSGTPIAGLTGVATITHQPGSEAALTPNRFVTGPNGVATLQLFTGQTDGIVTVSIACDKTAVLVDVPVGAPPGPPRTGIGATVGSDGDGGNDAGGAGLEAILAALVGSVGLGLVVRAAIHRQQVPDRYR